MSAGNIAEITAWICSGLIAAWMLTDMVRVSRKHDEDFLTSSAEEFDEAPISGSPELPDDQDR